MVRNQSYRMAAGTLTALALAADATALIRDWPCTLTSGGWLVAPGRRDDTSKYIVRQYVERSTGLNGHVRGVGGINTAWRIARMDDAMWAQLLTVLPDESTAVTIYTPDRHKVGGVGWETYTALAIRPSYDELKTHDGIWYVDTLIQFVNMQVAEPGEEEEEEEEEE